MQGSYIGACLDLLTLPRLVINKNEEPWTTKKGFLMGDPGTKIVLTLLSRVAYFSLYPEPTPDMMRRSQFQTVGDDIIAIGPKPLL